MNEPRVLQGVLYTTYECLRVCAVLLQPIIPGSAAAILDRLAVPATATARGLLALEVLQSTPRALGANTGVLFPRIAPAGQPATTPTPGKQPKKTAK